MNTTTVTETGQITLPDEIRQHLKLINGSRIEFIIDQHGQVKIVPINTPVQTLSGILYQPDREPVTLGEMEDAIAEGANDWT